LHVKSYQTANSEKTIEFVKSIVDKEDGAKIVLLWDGASYHRSQAFKDFLNQVNVGENWQVHCLRFAPYAPEENPIENIWGQVKKLLSQMHERCCSFAIAKRIFEFIIAHGWYKLPDLSKYNAFSSLI
jgi:transposase